MLKKYSFKTLVVLSLLVALVIPWRIAGAANGVILQDFSDFVNMMKNGQANVVRGVYVPGVLALRVMQQTSGDPGSVWRVNGVATQFSTAAQYHVIGLLAHNYLAGASFSRLMIGQEVRIVYGDGRVEYFIVNRLARFQALQPDIHNGNYVDLNSKFLYSTQDIFSMFYEGDFHVTFQTCIQQDGNPSWGRLFVTAIPIPNIYSLQIQTATLQALVFGQKFGY